MADIQKLYEQWLAKATADPDLKAELESIKDDKKRQSQTTRTARTTVFTATSSSAQEVCAELSAQAPTE